MDSRGRCSSKVHVSKRLSSSKVNVQRGNKPGRKSDPPAQHQSHESSFTLLGLQLSVRVKWPHHCLAEQRRNRGKKNHIQRPKERKWEIVCGEDHRCEQHTFSGASVAAVTPGFLLFSTLAKKAAAHGDARWSRAAASVIGSKCASC